MILKKNFTKLIFASAGVLTPWAAQAQSQRPPQKVVMAFDGCVLNSSWKEVHSFLDDMNKIDQDRLRFTFFMSATAFLRNDKASNYENPIKFVKESDAAMRDASKTMFLERAGRLKRGRTFSTRGESNIGWGGNLAEVKTRVDFVNSAWKKGNEIGSHAIGHFNGSKWTQQMWDHEFKEFNRIFNNIGSINGDPSIKFDMNVRDLVGFRAPFLAGGGNAPLVNTLNKYNYRYDTSDNRIGRNSNYWPQKFAISGNNAWNFGLAFIRVPGYKHPTSGTDKTLSMDYNFCFVQGSQCKDNEGALIKGAPVQTIAYDRAPEGVKAAKDDGDAMLLAYLRYFLDNYNGNRAPVHIGHHFTQYRAGVYNQAMYQFAKIVCELPEVECVTYENVANFMDGLNSKTHADYSKGNFPKAAYRPTFAELFDKAQSLKSWQGKKWGTRTGKAWGASSVDGAGGTSPTASTTPVATTPANPPRPVATPVAPAPARPVATPVAPAPSRPQAKALSNAELTTLAQKSGSSVGSFAACPFTKSEMKTYDQIQDRVARALRTAYTEACSKGISTLSAANATVLRENAGSGLANAYFDRARYNASEVGRLGQAFGAALAQMVEMASLDNQRGVACQSNPQLQGMNAIGSHVEAVQRLCGSKYGLLGRRR